MNPVLIFTAGYGEGHNAAARGLMEGFRAIGMGAEVLDLFRPAFGELYERSRKDYIEVVNRRPWLWSLTYQILDAVPVVPLLWPFLGPLRRELREALVQKRPEVVVSVYPIYGYLIEHVAREAGVKPPRCYTVVTDSITVNRVWHRCGSELFFVPNEDTLEVMLAAGIPRERLEVSGFPVSPQFAMGVVERPEPGAMVVPRVLLMINGQPARAVALVERLLREGQVALTVTAGKDERLKRELEEVALRVGRPLEVLGWVEDVPGLIRRHHVLIGKAGGAMVQEALAARTPMLVTQVLPGQEEGNARLLTQNGCGVVCPTNEAVLHTLRQLFADEAIAWRRMLGHVTRLGRPDASRELAHRIQALSQSENAGEMGQGFGQRGV